MAFSFALPLQNLQWPHLATPVRTFLGAPLALGDWIWPCCGSYGCQICLSFSVVDVFMALTLALVQNHQVCPGLFCCYIHHLLTSGHSRYRPQLWQVFIYECLTKKCEVLKRFQWCAKPSGDYNLNTWSNYLLSCEKIFHYFHSCGWYAFLSATYCALPTCPGKRSLTSQDVTISAAARPVRCE